MCIYIMYIRIYAYYIIPTSVLGILSIFHKDANIYIEGCAYQHIFFITIQYYMCIQIYHPQLPNLAYFHNVQKYIFIYVLYEGETYQPIHANMLNNAYLNVCIYIQGETYYIQTCSTQEEEGSLFIYIRYIYIYYI